LYAAGGYRQAADSFAHRATLEPQEAAHWHNLGLALHATGNVPAARAAWLRAARIAPRASEIRAAGRQLTHLDPESRQLAWVSPVTVAEAAMAGAALWVMGWVGYLFRKRASALVILGIALGVTALITVLSVMNGFETELRARILQRLKDRLDQGLIEEVKQLLDRGVSRQRLHSLGLEYRYVSEYLGGTIKNKNDLTQKLANAIGQYAKRQETWFRRMERNGTEIHWIDRGDLDTAKAICLKWARRSLAGPSFASK